jgi:hypothetical protein
VSDDIGNSFPSEDGVIILPTRVETLERQRMADQERDREFRERDDSYKRQQLELLGTQVRHDSHVVRLTRLLAAISVFGLAFTAYQSYLGKQSAEIARQAAGTAHSALTEGRSSFQATLEQMKAQTNAAAAAARAAAESVEIAREDARAAREQFRFDRRAWVGPIRVDMRTWTPGEPAHISVALRNNGATPALDVRARGRFGIRAPDWAFTAEYPATSVERGMGVLHPQTEMHMPFAVPATQERIDALKSGKDRLYLYGRIEYLDAFGRKHATTFCYLLLPDSSVSPCSTYNTAE